MSDEDRGVFDQCTETIVRQVDDIRRMVDEFSGFARMPKPIMEDRDLNAVVREAVFLQEVAQPNIAFQLDLPDEPVRARIDHRLVTQASPTSSRTRRNRSRAPGASTAGSG